MLIEFFTQKTEIINLDSDYNDHVAQNSVYIEDVRSAYHLKLKSNVKSCHQKLKFVDFMLLADGICCVMTGHGWEYFSCP